MQSKASRWRGVGHTPWGKWSARLSGQRSKFISQTYETEEAAARAHDRGAIAVFGREVAKINFPLEDYGAEVIF